MLFGSVDGGMSDVGRVDCALVCCGVLHDEGVDGLAAVDMVLQMGLRVVV